MQGWKVTTTSNKEKVVYYNAKLSFKKYNYFNSNNLDFERGGINVRGTLRKKKNWKLTSGAGYERRNQRDDTKDRNDYKLSCGYEKQGIKDDAIRTGINAEYTRRDFKNDGKKELYRIKLYMDWKI